MGLFEALLLLALVLAAGLLCWILIVTDRRMRDWRDYETIYRRSMGEIDGADLIQALRDKDADLQ